MIEMNTDAMSEICIELRKKENKLKCLYEDLAENVRADDDLSDEEVKEITMIIRKIEHDCKSFKKLISVAEKTLNLYSMSETKFLSLLSDCDKRSEKTYDIGINDLNGINKIMEKYRFSTER